jgi:hypothetical protein
MKVSLPAGVTLDLSQDLFSITNRKQWDEIAKYNRAHEGSLGAELLCAFLSSRAATVSERFSARLLSGLHRAGYWSLERSLLIASQHPNTRIRVESVLALCRDLSEAARDSLLQSLPASLQDKIRAARPPEPKGEPLALLEKTRAIPDHATRATEIIKLVPRLSADDLTRVPPLLLSCRGAYNYDDSWLLLLRALPAEKYAESLKLCDEISSTTIRAAALCALSVKAPPEEQQALLQRSFALTRDIPDFQRTKLFDEMGTLPPHLLKDVLALSTQIDEFYRAHLFLAIAHRLNESDLLVAWDIAKNIKDAESRAQSCCALVAYLPDAHRDTALVLTFEALEAIDPKSSLASSSRYIALRALSIKSIPASMEERLLAQISQEKTKADQEQLLSYWIPLLSPSRRDAHLTLLLTPPTLATDAAGVWSRVDPVRAPAALPRLSASEIEGQLQSIREQEGTMIDITDPHPDHSASFFALAPSVDAKTWSAALSVARSLNNQDVVPSALCAIIHAAPEDERAKLITEALQQARTLNIKHSRADAMLDLLPLVAQAERASLCREILLLLCSMDGSTQYSNDAQYRPAFLLRFDAVLVQLPRAERYEIIHELLQNLSQYTFSEFWVGLLSIRKSLASLVSTEDISLVFEEVRSLK